MSKKLIVLLALAGGGLAAYRKAQADRAEADLWSEATSPPDLR